MTEEKAAPPRRKRIPLTLDMADYELLVKRAAENDRFDWQEAAKIIRDTLRGTK